MAQNISDCILTKLEELSDKINNLENLYFYGQNRNNKLDDDNNNMGRLDEQNQTEILKSRDGFNYHGFKYRSSRNNNKPYDSNEVQNQFFKAVKSQLEVYNWAKIPYKIKTDLTSVFGNIYPHSKDEHLRNGLNAIRDEALSKMKTLIQDRLMFAKQEAMEFFARTELNPQLDGWENELVNSTKRRLKRNNLHITNTIRETFDDISQELFDLNHTDAPSKSESSALLSSPTQNTDDKTRLINTNDRINIEHYKPNPNPNLVGNPNPNFSGGRRMNKPLRNHHSERSMLPCMKISQSTPTKQFQRSTLLYTPPYSGQSHILDGRNGSTQNDEFTHRSTRYSGSSTGDTIITTET